jgi:A/G-specific adenine glycosylase
MKKEQVREFQKKILGWYEKNRRDLPWRHTRDPYRILLSEVMLQQTQVTRVIPKYEEWFHLFPTLEVLASASVSDVLRVWSGLGYNRRALFLKKLAEVLVGDYAGRFPVDEKMLLQLPGIGKYTARALLCFAFDKQVAVMDTNVKKVILTEVLKESFSEDFSQDKTITDKEIWGIAEELLPEGQAYDWNQALMDYASAMLKQEKIPIAKQSKFVGSRRYYRGKLVRGLLEKKSFTLEEASAFLEKERVWVADLVRDLEADGFVNVGEEVIKLR